MPARSGIEWTGPTINLGGGCTITAQRACKNCWAMRMANRQRNGAYEGLVKLVNGRPVWTGKVKVRHERLTKIFSWHEPQLSAVNLMTDTFHEGYSDEDVDAMLSPLAASAAMDLGHTFQLLTKRSERMRDYLGKSGTRARIAAAAGHLVSTLSERKLRFLLSSRYLRKDGGPSSLNARPWNVGRIAARVKERLLTESALWPLPNVWAGVTADTDEWFSTHWRFLREVPAVVRYVSVEPQFTHVNLPASLASELHWVIVGGESGGGSIPSFPGHFEAMLTQSLALGIPFLFKQWGDWHPDPERLLGMDNPLFLALQREDRGQRSNRIRSIGPNSMANEADSVLMYRIGKKRAGRLLGGRTWTQFPRGWVPPPSISTEMAKLKEYQQALPGSVQAATRAAFWPRAAVPA